MKNNISLFSQHPPNNPLKIPLLLHPQFLVSSGIIPTSFYVLYRYDMQIQKYVLQYNKCEFLGGLSL